MPEDASQSQGLNLFDKFHRIDDVPITVRAELDRRTITIRELLELGEGSVLSFPRPAGENVDVYAEEVLIGTGEIIIVDAALGVRIADLRELRPGYQPQLETAAGAR
jgi:flagellar motor switch protein FliN